MNDSTILISRKQVAELLGIGDCMTAVENAFRLLGEGKVPLPKVLGIHTSGGGFHIKAGMMNLYRNYFVAKTNANFPGNPKKFGLPTIQGVVEVFDGNDGRLLALMDSMEITIIRTGAATGVAAKYLSRKNSKAITICGCGNQGRISLKAISSIRNIETVFAFDIERSIAQKFVEDLLKESNVQAKVVDRPSEGTLQSDIVVTCTTSKKAFLNHEHVKPGAFIAAVGADSDDKQEIEPALISASKLVVDLTEQSATIGDFHHALQLELVSRSHIHAELGEIIAGKKQGRTSESEIIIFDSTGTALQDVAAAALVYERALIGNSSKFDFGN